MFVFACLVSLSLGVSLKKWGRPAACSKLARSETTCSWWLSLALSVSHSESTRVFIGNTADTEALHTSVTVESRMMEDYGGGARVSIG